MEESLERELREEFPDIEIDHETHTITVADLLTQNRVQMRLTNRSVSGYSVERRNGVGSTVPKRGR